MTQKELKYLLIYDKDTGLFTRRRKWYGKDRGALVGKANGRGYVEIGLYGTLYLAHRLVYLYVDGEFPTNQVDHINHNRGDNRLSNLRLATNKDNAKNRGTHSLNTSGHVGVTWDGDRSKWYVQIKVDGINKFLGRFTRFEDAVEAREQANKKYGFHVNHGRDY